MGSRSRLCLPGTAISIGVVPQIFTPVKWYLALVCYIIAPILAFCNAYGCGLTDWSLASTYGKLGLFIFAAWAGANGGVLVGLAVCGVMMSIVSTASDLMQYFKTGYLPLSSPCSMFVSQLVGSLVECFLAPVTFWMFHKAFDLGDPNGEYPAPYALVHRSMAVVGVEGFRVLPRHCLQLCYGFFKAGVAINTVWLVAKESLTVYSHSNGNGNSILHQWVFCNWHVLGNCHQVLLGENEQEEIWHIYTCHCCWFKLWRWCVESHLPFWL